MIPYNFQDLSPLGSDFFAVKDVDHASGVCCKNVLETMWKLADSLPESDKAIWVKDFCEVATCTNGNHHVPGILQSNLLEYEPPFTFCLNLFVLLKHLARYLSKLDVSTLKSET